MEGTPPTPDTEPDPLDEEVAAAERELTDDDLEPDFDDFDLVELPEPDELEYDPAPEPGSEGDDNEVVGAEPQPVAETDAPIDDPIDIGEGVVPGPPGGGDPREHARILRRWLPRLRYREQLLAAARRELAGARTDAARRHARFKVSKREAQVSYARRIVERHRAPQTTVVERVLRAALLGNRFRDRIAYTQHPVKRWEGVSHGCRAKNGQYPRFADCSSFVTWCYWDALGGPQAGRDIINASSWRAGYTGTQLDCGRQVPAAQARPGDLAFYRRGGAIGHVTLVIGPNKVISHGSEPGPLVATLNYDGTLAQVRRYVA